MANNRRKKSNRRLVDMSAAPAEPEEYRPPDRSRCDEEPWAASLSESDRIFVRPTTYRGKVVDFAIMQQVLIDDEWVEVARIDTNHGTVHRHLFRSDGSQERIVIETIPTGKHDSWTFVDSWLQKAFDMMFNEWESWRRQWRVQ